MDNNTQNLQSNESDSFLKNFARELFDWLETFAFAFCFVILVFTFLSRVVTVDGSSMYPTLKNRDRLIISNLFYTPKTGDIVVINTDYQKEPLIKRVIASEGQTVDIDFETWTVTVDGEVLKEDYVNFIENEKMLNLGSVTYPHKVSEGHIFVMGDNRNASLDGRSPLIGEIKNENVLGRVLLRLFPLDKFGKVLPATSEVSE